MSVFDVTFWGVRGTVPTPGGDNAVFGGNTSCVQVDCGGRTLIFDAGTGIYPLGEHLVHKDIDILFSHTHIDHIMGLPFFSGIYDPDYQVDIWAGHLSPNGKIESVVRTLMQPPLFPLTLEDLKAQIRFHDFIAGEYISHPKFDEAGIEIRTLPLNHPDRATAYRVNCDGKSVCYVTDVEHRDDTSDKALVDFIRGTDVFIYDSTFDDHDFERFRGWGHSTWQHAIRLGNDAGVDQVVLFHHDPGMNDEALDVRAKQAEFMRENTIVAREGLTLHLLERKGLTLHAKS